MNQLTIASKVATRLELIPSPTVAECLENVRSPRSRSRYRSGSRSQISLQIRLENRFEIKIKTILKETKNSSKKCKSKAKRQSSSNYESPKAESEPRLNLPHMLSITRFQLMFPHVRSVTKRKLKPNQKNTQNQSPKEVVVTINRGNTQRKKN